jgi:hypothetical protein
MKQLLLFLALALGFNQTTQPISVSNARIVAGAIAVSAASGAFYLTASDEASKRKYDLDEQGNPKKISLVQKYKMPVLAAAVAGAAVGGLGYWLLYGYTPEWTFSERNHVLATIKNDPISNADFNKTPVNDFIQMRWGRFAYYLVKAKKAAYGLVDRCDYALGLTEKLKRELPVNVGIDQVIEAEPAITAAKANAHTVVKATLSNVQYATQEAALEAARIAEQHAKAVSLQIKKELSPGVFVVIKP